MVRPLFCLVNSVDGGYTTGMYKIKRRDFLKLVAGSSVGAVLPLPKSSDIFRGGTITANMIASGTITKRTVLINGKPAEAYLGITDFETGRRHGERSLAMR